MWTRVNVNMHAIKKIKEKLSRKFLNYLIIGGTAFGVEYTAFIALQALSIDLLISQAASFSMGLLVSFLGNRFITFSTGDRENYYLNKKAQFGLYLTLAGCNLVLSTVIIYVLVNHLLIIPAVAKIIVMAMIVSWNYLIFNKIIFRSK